MRSSLSHTAAPRHRALPFVSAVLAAAMLAEPSAALAERRPTDLLGGRALRDISAAEQNAPDIDAAAGLLMTADGRVLWSRNSTQRRAMASTTKMMTALVVMGRAKPSDLVTVPKEAAAVAQNAVDLTPGERLTVTQLLEAMLVASANDAAFALAKHVGGSIDGFVGMMNDKAAELGLKDTHYRNPHGLDVPGHYSSAADLAALGRVAMRNTEFRRIVALREVVIPGPNGQARVFETTDDLLASYPGMEGIKTGMTNDAGYCLVSAARRGRVQLFGVILGTPSEQARFVQSRALLDWGFAHYRPYPVIQKGTRVGTVPVNDWLDRDIVARVREGTSAVLFDLGGAVRRKYELRPSIGAPVRKGQVVGVVTAYQGDSILATEAVVSAEDMAAPRVLERVRIWGVRSWRAVFGPREVRTAIVTATE